MVVSHLLPQVVAPSIVSLSLIPKMWPLEKKMSWKGPWFDDGSHFLLSFVLSYCDDP